MSQILLAWRLIWGDLRRHPVEAAVFLIAITVASATLALALALNGVTGTLFGQTQAATAGPDVVAYSVGGTSGLATVGRAPGVTGRSGPYPLVYTTVTANGHAMQAVAEGRSVAPATIDRPLVTAGSWLRPGGVVVERGFAYALGVRLGEWISVDGRVFPVVGIAVSTAAAVYPWAESAGPDGGTTSYSGLVWLTETDARALPTQYPLMYALDLRLADPANAQDFADSFDTSGLPVNFMSWQTTENQDDVALRSTEPVLYIGAWLLGFLAIAGVAGLAAGRALQQTRRVGLLKAVGAAPGLVAAVLLIEYLVLALLAAAAGLLIGWLIAPAAGDPSAGLIGQLAPPALPAIIEVAFLAVTAAAITTLAPTLRAARTSTVRALADSPHLPRRSGLTALIFRLPVALLLGIHLTGRRPVRTLLHAAGITATVTAITALLIYYAQPSPNSIIADPNDNQGRRTLLAVTVALIILAAVNVIVITWTAALETRRPLAIARTVGATPRQVMVGICLGQILPVLPAALLGIPVGIALYDFNAVGTMTMPSLWVLLVGSAGMVVAVAALTAFAVRAAARRPPAQSLASSS